MSASKMGLFSRLPRELRDLIYTFYLVVDGGYVGDGDSIFHNTLLTKKHEQNRLPRSTLQRQQCILRRADRSSTDIALVFTCKSIAEEMYRGDLALRVNTITFSTFYSDELRLRAGRFNYIREEHVEVENVNIFQHLGECFWGPVYDELQNTYPIFMPLVDAVRKGKPPSNIHSCPHYGQARSLYSGFVKYALQLAAYYHPPEFVQAVEQHRLSKKRKRRGQFDPHHIAHCSVEAWDIPTRADLLHLASHTRSSGEPLLEVQVRRGVLPEDGTKYRFSAAVSAIHFLRAIPKIRRTNLRRIVLVEDRESVSDPACHAQGLIPFCQENRLLRVERRCNLWRNVFCRDWVSDRDRQYRVDMGESQLSSKYISWNVAQWIMEALVLEFYGMPDGSFSLVLDGNPAPQRCEEIFQRIVQRDVARQLVRSATRNRSHLPMKTSMEQDSEHVPRHSMYVASPYNNYGYMFEDFPQAMEDIREDKSIVRCNFHIGTPLNVEGVLKKRRRIESALNSDWFQHEPKKWDTVPPLPSWGDLLAEDLLSSAT